MSRPASKAEAALLSLRELAVSGLQGQPVAVDTDPRCQHCGKKQGEYFGRPWSLKCRNCGQQATAD